MQPQVRNLQSLIAEQNKALQPQYDLIQSDIAANAKAGEAQVAGLEAKKDTAFSDINQEAQNKGMFFSGFAPDAQAKYTAGTYLPALAQLQQTIAQTRSGLLGKKADLGKTAFDTAFTANENDRAILADWNSLTKQQQFTASQAQKDRAFQASERVASQQFDAGQNAQGRAADKATPQDVYESQLIQYSGEDSKVSPQVYKQLRANYVRDKNGTAKDFNDRFWGLFVNDTHWQDYL